MKSVYKCRLCGESFEKGKVSEEVAYLWMCGLTINEYVDRGRKTFCRTDTHMCKDGSIGFTDFQGFKKEEKEK